MYCWIHFYYLCINTKNNMEIIKKIKGKNSNFDKYEIKCKCGNIFYPNVNNVESGKTTSCGKGSCHSKFNDITGRTFTDLKVVSLNKETLKWKVECVCGTIKEYHSSTLTNGKTTSCGCMTGKKWSDSLNKGEDSIWVSLYNSYKTGAKNRKYSFNITLDEFKSRCLKECHYCGRVGSTIRNRHSKYKKVSLSYNGLDRYDNSKGYELNNVVTCCSDCNYAKGQKSFSEYEAWIKQLVNNNKITKIFKL